MFVQQVSMVTPPGGFQLIALSALATRHELQSTRVEFLVQKFSARTAQRDIRVHCVISKFIKIQKMCGILTLKWGDLSKENKLL